MDEFQHFTKGLTSPATRHFAIQPDDVVDLPILPRVIYCQTEGTIMIRDSEGIDLPYKMMAGDQLAVRGCVSLASVRPVPITVGLDAGCRLHRCVGTPLGPSATDRAIGGDWRHHCACQCGSCGRAIAQ